MVVVLVQSCLQIYHEEGELVVGGECVAGSCLGDLGLLWRLVLLFGGCTVVV